MADKLYEIYEKFTEQVVYQGWKGVFYGYMETVRSEVEKGGWALFELDNGFRLGLNEPGEGSDEAPCLQYWFGNENITPVIVDSLEQLLQLLE